VGRASGRLSVDDEKRARDRLADIDTLTEGFVKTPR
jgi:hypothetical protein